jgi:hypothetical protein
MKYLKYHVSEEITEEKIILDLKEKNMDIKNYPEILGEIDMTLLPKANELKKRKIINNILDFANELEAFGVKHSLISIVNYSKILLNAAHSYDVMKIDRALDKFGAIVNSLKE